MTDTNPTRARYAENKHAFMDVFGDPSNEDEFEGHYNLLKRGRARSLMAGLGEGSATPNPATPSPLDFFCDVENALKEVITDEKTLTKFVTTYILGDSQNILTPAECNQLEQRLGKLFRARHIAPVSEYFRTIRKPIKKENIL